MTVWGIDFNSCLKIRVLRVNQIVQTEKAKINSQGKLRDWRISECVKFLWHQSYNPMKEIIEPLE